VPSAAKNAGQSNPAKAGSLPFEEALKKLETIVTAMEGEDLPAEAELKIQQLEKTAAGEIKLRPLALPEGSAE
jgi:hypothetical protein